LKAKKKSTKGEKVANNNTPKTNLDLLLSLDEDISGVPVMNANSPGRNGNNQMLLIPTSGSAVLLPSTSGSAGAATGSIEDASAMFVSLKETELLSKMATGGLQVQYRYTRKPHLFSASMTSIQITLNNLDSKEDLTDIKIGSKTLAPGMSMHDFPGISKMNPNESRTVKNGINFNNSK
jgi:AP-3 complex subunit beta